MRDIAPDGLVVAPDGKDDAAGTADAPLSLTAAVRKIAGAGAEGSGRAAGVRTGNVVVRLAPGTYYLRETLVLGAGTGVTGGVTFEPLRFAAADRQPPAVVFSGGVPLALKWEAAPEVPARRADGSPAVFKAAVPAAVRPFDQLFVNGEQQVLARYPNFDPAARYFNGVAGDAIAPERIARWRDPAGAFLHALHDAHWGGMHFRVLGKTDDGRALRMEGGWQNNRPSPPHRKIRFVENVFEELDAPGEWFFDAKTRTLFFCPPAKFFAAGTAGDAAGDAGTAATVARLNAASIVVPQLETLVKVGGDAATGAGAVTGGVALRGIAFRHTLRTFMQTREPLQRSDWRIARVAAVVFENTAGCSLTGAEFSDLGGNAILVNNRNTGLRLASLHIHDTGGNGVIFLGDPAAARAPFTHYGHIIAIEPDDFAKMVDGAPGPRGDNFPRDCSLEDALITRTGTVEKQTAGVTIDLAQRITVRHCTIAGVPRAGINIGAGTWGGHRITDCDVFDTVRETGDHGSFNSWGRDRFWFADRARTERLLPRFPTLPLWDAVEPVVLDRNRWRCDHGWDIDLDDGSTNYVITRNLCLNGGLKLREGFARRVENNITVNNTFHPHVWYRESGDTVRRNIFFRPYADIWMPKTPWGADVDYNFVHTPAAIAAPAVPAATLQKKSRRDAHSLTGDARFLDPAAGDYRVADDSPALALGFKNFPTDNYGVRPAWLRERAPKVQLPVVKTAAGKAAAGKAAVGKSSRSTGVHADTGSGGTTGTAAGEAAFLSMRVKNIAGFGELSALGLAREFGVVIVADAAKSPLARDYGVRDGDVILAWGTAGTGDLRALRAAAAATPAPASLKIWRDQRELTLPRRR